jgi:hypothetical protein
MPMQLADPGTKLIALNEDPCDGSTGDVAGSVEQLLMEP